MMKIKGSCIPAIGSVLGLALAAISPLSVAASVSAGAAITNVQFTVGNIDGYGTGGVRFLEQKSWINADSDVGGWSYHQDYSDLRAANLSISSSTAQVQASHSGVAGEMQGRSEVSGADQAGTSSFQDRRFMLLPHSSISVSGHISGFVESGAGLPNASAASDVRIYLWVWDEHVSGGYLGQEVTGLSLDYVSPYSATYSKDFNLTYANHTDQEVSMFWTSYEHTYVGNVGQVPEPEGYVMMAAGLMLLGVVARRRKKDKA
ncbi:PEP-CTERM sorting domain-containing protein [Rugamonas aquatica]|uniref:PEP-CTERM sorting domain-containing protein n=1 Tax=Rugamonas aquatica TaxID=2743357 RepID=A0A6A7MVH8_9BURK|nr:PEP-CTERM sorting domain-containing protein [Rugamonas aquatica]MQA36660.1 PEP-CTERM sorting domain-containing protein [Rugamonas aquatica]